MQVIWQNDDGISYKRLFAVRLAKCRAQQFHMVYQRR